MQWILTIKKIRVLFNPLMTLHFEKFKLLSCCKIFCLCFAPSLQHLSNQRWAYGILRNHLRFWNAPFFGGVGFVVVVNHLDF